MPECDENILDTDVFIRVDFSTFFVTWVWNLRLWDLILKGFEGPGLPYGPPGYALLQTTEIHDFQAPPRISVPGSGGGFLLVWEP